MLFYLDTLMFIRTFIRFLFFIYVLYHIIISIKIKHVVGEREMCRIFDTHHHHMPSLALCQVFFSLCRDLTIVLDLVKPIWINSWFSLTSILWHNYPGYNQGVVVSEKKERHCNDYWVKYVSRYARNFLCRQVEFIHSNCTLTSFL